MQNKAGQPIPTGLPQTPWEPLNEAAAEYDGLLAERSTLYARRQELDRQLRDAQGRDREAWADAMETKGTAAARPGTKHTDRVRKEIEEAEERMSALDILIRRKQAAIVALVETNRDGWLADNAEAMASDYRIYADAITEAAAARQRLDQRRGLTDWLTRFNVEAVYRSRTTRVAGLVGANGEPVIFDAVLSALLADAKPPEPVKPGPHHRNQWPAMGFSEA